VQAFNSLGHSFFSASVGASTLPLPPPAPSGLTAAALSQTQIALSWSDVANNESGFRIERSVNFGITFTRIAVVGIYASTDGVTFIQIATVPHWVVSFSHTGLSSASRYFYRVSAYNADGESAYSNVVTAMTPDVPPVQPSNLSALAVSKSQINLAWTDNSTNETGYQIERSTDGMNFVQVAALGANIAAYSDAGLTASTTYCYRVRAVNSAGNSPYTSYIVSATTIAAAVPTAPSDLAAKFVSSSQINLSWKDRSTNEAQFMVEQSLNGTTFTQIAVLGANLQSYAASSLQPSTKYYFRVRAYNTAGYSPYSNTGNAKTPR
jgi:predicted phage tail protein